MNREDFDCFRIAFDYVQKHRFNQRGSVEEFHLVGMDGDVDPTFEKMLKSVYKAIRQARDHIDSWQEAGFPD